MACDTDQILTSSRCYATYFTGDMYEVAMILLLCRIIDGDTGSPCDPQTLANDPEFACISCNIPPGSRRAVIVSLLCQLATQGCGGGGGECFVEAETDGVEIGSSLGFFAYDNAEALVGVTSLTFKMTTNVEGFDFSNTMPDLETISFPNLVSITDGSYISIQSGTVLSSIQLPVLVSATDIKIKFCPALVSLSLPLLQTISVPALQITNNSSLSTLSLPSLVPINGDNYEFQVNALSAASVNGILARFVATAGYVSGILRLEGGTNSAPTGQGILDKATLLGRGVALSTN